MGIKPPPSRHLGHLLLVERLLYIDPKMTVEGLKVGTPRSDDPDIPPAQELVFQMYLG